MFRKILEWVENMDYEIIRMYTEKLHISAFHELLEKGSKIDLLINVNTNIQPSNVDGNSILKITYDVFAKDSPISLSWVGVCILKFEESLGLSLQPIDLLEDKTIKTFVDDNIDHLSFFINGELPKTSDFMGNNDAD